MVMVIMPGWPQGKEQKNQSDFQFRHIIQEILITMVAIVSYIKDNGPEIIGLLFAIHAVALAIVNMTPTPKDDRIVARYYRVLEILAGIVTKLSKD